MLRGRRRRVLLVGWDAADWLVARPLLERGWMPHLQGLMGRGASGPLQAAPPLLSATLWTSLATGVGPVQHGVLGATEMRPDHGGLQPVGRGSRLAPAIWEWLDSNGVPSCVVGFPATHPMTPLSGLAASDAFPDSTDADGVWPREVQQDLAGLRILPGQVDAASLLSFVPRLGEIDARSDPRPAILASILARTASAHALATSAIADDAWAFAAACYAGLGQFSRAFMPYHGSRHGEISGRDHELYSGVVAGAYRFHDQMLGRLIELAGEGTTVLLASSHGFRSGRDRPTATGKGEIERSDWHRREGIIAIAGPGIEPATAPADTGILDVAPTVLSLFGFEPAPGMKGTPSRAVARGAPTRTLANPVTWREDGAPKAEGKPVAYLRSLGYAEMEDPYATAAADRLEADRQYAVAQARIGAGELGDAISVLRHIATSHPAVELYRIALAEAYAATGQAEPMTRLLEEFLRLHPTSPLAMAGMGVARMLAGDSAAAISWLSKARSQATGTAWLLVEVGRAFLQLGEFGEAVAAFSRAVTLDEGLAAAHGGSAQACRKAGDSAGAVKAARTALGLRPGEPAFRKQLGLALLANGDAAEALGSLEASLGAEPSDLEVVEALAKAHDLAGDAGRARELRGQAFNLLSRKWLGRAPTFDMALRTRG